MPACIVVTLFRCTFQALLSVEVYVPVAHTYCTTNVESERSASLAWRNHVAIGACRLCSALNWLAVGRLPCCTHTAAVNGSYAQRRAASRATSQDTRIVWPG